MTLATGKGILRQPGFEPGSPAWGAGILYHWTIDAPSIAKSGEYRDQDLRFVGKTKISQIHGKIAKIFVFFALSLAFFLFFSREKREKDKNVT